MKKQDLLDEVQALRRALAWMDLVLSNLNDAIFVIDKDWRLTFTNSALAELLGKERVLLLGEYMWDALPLTIDGETLKVKIEKQRIKLNKLGKINGTYDLNLSGISRIAELRCTPIPSLQQAVGILTDTTIEVRAMRQLHELQPSKERPASTP